MTHRRKDGVTKKKITLFKISGFLKRRKKVDEESADKEKQKKALERKIRNNIKGRTKFV